MKGFFANQGVLDHAGPTARRVPQPVAEPRPGASGTSPKRHRARLAVYDSKAAAPRVTDIEADTVDSFIESVSATTYRAASELGGELPYTAIREVAENLIHADFAEPVVSVLDSGRTVRFADRGPGIPDKQRAVMPGFSTASGAMKRHIRGVGSGLPIVGEYLSHQRGALEIDDNLGGGAVVTLKSAAPDTAPRVEAPQIVASRPSRADTPQPAQDVSLLGSALPRLSTRHKRVLSLVMEVGAAGPTLVSKELGVGLSTAHRDLACLEDAGLIAADAGGKRVLTAAGAEYLDGLFD
jgi:hypothetical protein